MLNTEVDGVTFDHAAVAGIEESLNETLYVLVYDWYITAPLDQLTPTEGSPALFELGREAGAA
jgi:hypothetical protein